MIKVVVFDLDDTLYNEKDFVFGAFKEVAIYLSKKYGISANILYEDMLSILHKEGRGKIFNIICDNYNINEDIKALVQVYRNSKPKLNLYEDSIEILNKLRCKYKLGLITDGLAYVQWNKIKILDLEKHFDNIIVTDELGREYWKPHIMPFQNMADKFKVSPKECIYIGDNPSKDFFGAKKIGYKTIRIIRQEGDHIKARLDKNYEADYDISSLDELIPIIQDI
ncbi:HAD family hydrolase [Clostridium brassicae]|uniref:HAD-IA family hydrolase n=1 Tax=Clostridium brassicae TaxID=2999072 RepID=A0ABT4DBA1_9CLOT|nr:HAD-IA family hydrolase [Clostridium brassicae]MCY6959582.1 HAD-IA family hydrolase [Clostridium brassicae]